MTRVRRINVTETKLNIPDIRLNRYENSKMYADHTHILKKLKVVFMKTLNLVHHKNSE